METTDLIIRAFRPNDRAAVTALWRASGLVVPHNDPVLCINLTRKALM